jgi:hypothetical protein
MIENIKTPAHLRKQGVWMRILALGLLLVAIGSAQEARVGGRVTDSSGGVIPDVKVTITNTDTKISRATTTNSLGLYTLPLLQPGNYKISAEKKGFRTSDQALVLQVDQRATMDITMQVGELTQEVSINAAPPLLDTVEPSVGQVIENRQVVEMPLNGRNYINLGLISGGTADPVANSRDQGFSAGGQRLSANNYLLDGADNNSYELADAGRMGGMVAPSIDAIQEFKVQSNSYSAEYGRGTGAVINVTTKSGSNQVHGAAYEFLRNNDVDAKNFFAVTNPQYQRNQYGFAAGGPIIKNKTFIFGDWERTNIRQGQSAVSTIPTLAEKTGNFSQEQKTLINPLTGTPFPGNMIPASSIDPIAAKLIALYPTPVNGNLASNYLFAGPTDEDDLRYDVRVDHTFREKDSIYGRISHYGVTIPGVLKLPAPAFGANAFDETITGWSDFLAWNHIFSGSLIAVTRISWSYNQFSRVNPAVAGTANLNAKYGIPGGDDSIPGGFSSFAITGYQQLGLGANNPTIRDSQNRQVMSDFNWSRGAHSLKFGFNLLRIQNNIVNDNFDIGLWTFNGQFTGDGMADFLLGWSSTWQGSIQESVNLRGWLPAAYVQDDWKVSKKLTVNLGMRYEVGLPFYDKQNRFANFVMDQGAPHLVLASGSGEYTGQSLVNIDTNGWEPRVGMAYQLDSKTVLRTGYGIYRTYFEPQGDTQFLSANPPFAYQTSIAASKTVPAVVLKTGPPPGAVSLAHATGLVFTSFPTTPHRAYAQQWNFNIQRQLASNWMLEVGYLGVKGVHLISLYEGNFAPPEPGNINANRPIQSAVIPPSGIVVSPIGGVYRYSFNGNSDYQAMVVKLEKPLTQGLTLLTSYTWSKTMGDTCSGSADGNAANCGFQDPLNMTAERALDNQNMGQRFVASLLYDIPVGRGRRFGSQMPKLLNGLAGGWELGGIFTSHSGLPYSLIDSGNPANTGTFTIVNRPNVIGDPYSVPWTVGKAFNTAAFALQPLYTYGSLGRNTGATPRVSDLDLILSKVFNVTERVRLQTRFEVFNATNTPPFTTAPNATVGTNGFGQTSAAGAPRELQFALKALF